MYGASLATIPPGVDGQACLEALQARVRGADGPRPGSAEDKITYFRSDHMLVRFLIARQWDVEKATVMLREHYRWLEEKNLSAIINTPFPEEPHIKKYYPQAYHGCDKLGRPLYIERPGKIDMPRLLQQVHQNRLVDYFAVGSELQMRRRLPACSLMKGEVVDKSLNILDLEGLGFSLVSHATARQVVKDIAQMNQGHYPEMMGKLIIINAPKVFKIAWSFVKPMLDDRTVEKISIHGTDKQAFSQALLELVDEEQLPALFGGKCICDGKDPGSCMMQVKGPWVDPEISKILDEHPLEYLMSPEGARMLVERKCGKAAGSAAVAGDSEASAADAASTDEVEQAAARVAEEEEKDESPAPLPTKPPSFDTEALDQAQRVLAELAEEHQRLEDAHTKALSNWVDERNAIVQEVGRFAIERAQGYYDSMSIWNQVVQEYTAQQKEVDTVNGYFSQAVKSLAVAESAFEAFLLGKDGDLSEEEWAKLASLEGSCTEIIGNAKLERAYRVSALSDKVASLQRQREAALGEADAKRREMEDARMRFLQEDQNHQKCGWNCSVKRAAPYYQKRRYHESIIDAQQRSVRALEQQLHAARFRVVQMQDEPRHVPKSPSVRSALSARYSASRHFDEISLHSFELPGARPDEDEFLSCASGDS